MQLVLKLGYVANFSHPNCYPNIGLIFSPYLQTGQTDAVPLAADRLHAAPAQAKTKRGMGTRSVIGVHRKYKKGNEHPIEDPSIVGTVS